jgi:hypothetical protein
MGKEDRFIMKKLLGLIFSIMLVAGVFVPDSALASTGYTSQSNSSGLLTGLLSFLNLGSKTSANSQFNQSTSYQQNSSYQDSSKYYNQNNANSDCWNWLTDLWNFCCGGSDGGHDGGGGDDLGGDGGCDNGGGGKDCFSNNHGQCSSADVWKQWYGN